MRSAVPRPSFQGSGSKSPRGPSPLLSRRAQRYALNIPPIFQCILLPWIFFCGIFALTSFDLHYTNPRLYQGILGVSSLFVVILICAAGSSLRIKYTYAEAPHPSWFVFLVITMAVALVLGALLGSINFDAHLQPYYSYQSLNKYYAVDPTTTKGQELSDAGRIHFVNDTLLDLSRSMGFMNYDTYCVAPISKRTSSDPRMLSTMAIPKLDSYDFWAVGLNCCSGGQADFQCGEFQGTASPSGLRLLRTDQQEFFQLAVQQAQAAYTIKANSPIFVYYSSDATADMKSFRDEGLKYYLIGMLVHFAWQILSVVLAAVAFSRLEQK